MEILTSMILDIVYIKYHQQPIGFDKKLLQILLEGCTSTTKFLNQVSKETKTCNKKNQSS